MDTPANPHPRHLLTRLQREWNRLAVSPSALATARRWALCHSDMTSLEELLLRSGYGTATSGTGGDAVLRELVRLAQTDALAARVVLQRLLPGISTIARRNRPAGADLFDTADEAVATAWTVIRLYPIEHRPTFVALNLLREIEYQAFRKDRRRKCEFIPTHAPSFDTVAAADPARSPAEELRELLDEARSAGFAQADVDLVERLGAGARPEELAAEMKVTPRTIRNHRATVAHRLRQLALAS